MSQASSRTPDAFADTARLVSAIKLTGELLHEISPKFFESTDHIHEQPPEHLGHALASALYGAADMKTASLPETEGRELLTSGFTTVLLLSETCASAVASGNDRAGSLLSATLAIISTLSEATAHASDFLELAWKPEAWSDVLVRCLGASPATPAAFPLHAAVIHAILTLAHTPSLRPALQKNRRPLIEVLTSKVRFWALPFLSFLSHSGS